MFKYSDPLRLVSLTCGSVKFKNDSFNVPTFLIDAFNLVNYGIKMEGIFSNTDSLQRIEMKCPFFGDFQLPDGATLFHVWDLVKLFFLDLEEPLLTNHLEPLFLKYHTMSNDETKIRYILDVCQVLPQVHKDTLAFLMRYLKRIASFSEFNKTSGESLALNFVPFIFRSEPPEAGSLNGANSLPDFEIQQRDKMFKTNLLEILIEHAEEIQNFQPDFRSNANDPNNNSVMKNRSSDKMRKDFAKVSERKERIETLGDDNSVIYNRAISTKFDASCQLRPRRSTYLATMEKISFTAKRLVDVDWQKTNVAEKRIYKPKSVVKATKSSLSSRCNSVEDVSNANHGQASESAATSTTVSANAFVVSQTEKPTIEASVKPVQILPPPVRLGSTAGRRKPFPVRIALKKPSRKQATPRKKSSSVSLCIKSSNDEVSVTNSAVNICQPTTEHYYINENPVFPAANETSLSTAKEKLILETGEKGGSFKVNSTHVDLVQVIVQRKRRSSYSVTSNKISSLEKDEIDIDGKINDSQVDYIPNENTKKIRTIKIVDSISSKRKRTLIQPSNEKACEIGDFSSSYKSERKKWKKLNQLPNVSGVVVGEVSTSMQMEIPQVKTNRRQRRTHCSASVDAEVCNTKMLENLNTKESHRLKCTICTDSFSDRAALSRHMFTHTGEKRFSCKTCSLTFYRLDNFNYHTLTHTGEKPFACKSCDRAFSRKDNLKCHENRMHGERRVPVEEINEKLVRFRQSGEPMFQFHENSQQFECLLCGRTLAKRNVMKRHLLKHTGEKPFACKFCHFAFSRQDNLKCHEKRFHVSQE